MSADVTFTCDQKAKAFAMHSHFCRGESFLALNVAHQIYATLDQLTKVTQGKGISLSGSMEAVDVTITALTAHRDKFDNFYAKVERIVDTMDDVELISLPRVKKVSKR
jgi:hypothetical protein